MRVQWFSDPMLRMHLFFDVALEGVYLSVHQAKIERIIKKYRHTNSVPAASTGARCIMYSAVDVENEVTNK